MIMGVIFCLSFDLFHAINLNVHIISMIKCILVTDILMKLQVPAKELCNVCSYEIDNTN